MWQDLQLRCASSKNIAKQAMGKHCYVNRVHSTNSFTPAGATCIVHGRACIGNMYVQ